MELLGFWYAILFVFGTILGSFLNVVVFRQEKGEKLTGRSHCQRCKKILTAAELIPVVSYVIQKGKCRSCKKPLSLQYPLVEVLTGLLFVGIALVLGLPLTLAEGLIFLLHGAIGCLLICILAYDLRNLIIPNTFVYPFNILALALLFLAVNPGGDLTLVMPSIANILAGPLIFLPFFLLWFFSGGKWLGLGDGKLVIGMGWMLGSTGVISAVMLAFWIGAIVSVILITLQNMGTKRLRVGERELTMKSEIPFAPFLILGYSLVFFFGLDILHMIVG